MPADSYTGLLTAYVGRYWQIDDKPRRVFKPAAYLALYESLFGPVRLEVKAVLEMGVFWGRSLLMWEEFFPKAVIVGLDHNPTQARFEDGRVKVRIGKQADVEFLTQVAAEFGPFDVIIDDCSHRWEDQRVAFSYFRPAPWRFYAVEDLQTSYVDHDWPEVPGISAKPFVDVLHQVERGMHTTRLDARYPASADADPSIRQMTTIAGLTILEKHHG